jgi:hypothetical protein
MQEKKFHPQQRMKQMRKKMQILEKKTKEKEKCSDSLLH